MWAKNNKKKHPDLAIIFDSGNPTGKDYDLGAPNEDFGGPGIGNGGRKGQPGENAEALGNLVIVAENDKDKNKDGFVDDPDDEGKGGVLYFEFDEPRSVASVRLLDAEGGTVRAYDSNDNLLTAVDIAGLGNNAVEDVILQQANVKRIEVELAGSGGVSSFTVCPISNTSQGTLGDFQKVFAFHYSPENTHSLIFSDLSGSGQTVTVYIYRADGSLYSVQEVTLRASETRSVANPGITWELAPSQGDIEENSLYGMLAASDKEFGLIVYSDDSNLTEIPDTAIYPQSPMTDVWWGMYNLSGDNPEEDHDKGCTDGEHGDDPDSGDDPCEPEEDHDKGCTDGEHGDDPDSGDDPCEPEEDHDKGCTDGEHGDD
ncbi:MAG: hypothetical protein D6790_17255, partial [Caldilineae bacterium]